MNELKTAACYIRVSTDSQTELSPHSQLEEIRKYAKANDYIIPDEYIYQDDGISGRSADKRPQFNAMVNRATRNPKPFDAIIVWKFSRFARNREESTLYKALLRKAGVSVISVSEPMSDDPFSSLNEAIIEWMDEYYSQRLSGEVRRGMKERARQGKHHPSHPFGFDYENGKITPNDDADTVRWIFEQYISGEPIRSLALTLTAQNDERKWSHSSISYILRNRSYIGELYTTIDDEEISIPDHHEAIIDRDLFDKVQAKLDSFKRHNSYNRREQGMYHGLLRCSSCGKALSRHKNKGKISYQCLGYSHSTCSESHFITQDKLNELFFMALKIQFENESFHLEYKPSKTKPKKTDTQALIDKAKKKLERVRTAYENEVYTLEEFKESKQKIEAEIEQLSFSLQEPVVNDKQIVREFISKNKKMHTELQRADVSDREKNSMLKSFVDRIVYNKKEGSIDIYFYY